MKPRRDFALGIETEILFALLQSKKIGEKSPLERPKKAVSSCTQINNNTEPLFRKLSNALSY